MKKAGSGKPHKGRVIVLDLFIVLALAIAGFSAFKIYNIVNNYRADQKVYSQVQNEARPGDEDVDWDKLKAINPDTVGWIKIDGTKIDYPIVLSHNNDEYLHTLFDGSYGNAGCIFADCNTDNPFNQFNTIVYGHHMKDGSMFENLKYYKDAEYAIDHGRLELLTPEQDYYLVVAAFLNCPSDSEIYTNNVGMIGGGDSKAARKERAEYLKAVEKYAEYTTDVTLEADDKIVVLSTCAYEYEGARYVIVGKLVNF